MSKSVFTHRTVCFRIQSSVQTYQEEVLRVVELWQTDCQTHPEKAHLTLNMWVGQLLLK